MIITLIIAKNILWKFRYYIFSEGRDFNFLKINLRGNEDIFNNVKKLADLFDDDKKIIIK